VVRGLPASEPPPDDDVLSDSGASALLARQLVPGSPLAAAQAGGRSRGGAGGARMPHLRLDGGGTGGGGSGSDESPLFARAPPELRHLPAQPSGLQPGAPGLTQAEMAVWGAAAALAATRDAGTDDDQSPRTVPGASPPPHRPAHPLPAPPPQQLSPTASAAMSVASTSRLRQQKSGEGAAAAARPVTGGPSEAAASYREGYEEGRREAEEQRDSAAALQKFSFYAAPAPAQPAGVRAAAAFAAVAGGAQPEAEALHKASSRSNLAAIAEAARARASARERAREEVKARAQAEAAAARPGERDSLLSAALARGSAGQPFAAASARPEPLPTERHAVSYGAGGWADSLLAKAPPPPQLAFDQPIDVRALLAQVEAAPDVAPFTAATAALAHSSTQRMLAAERLPAPERDEPASLESLLAEVVRHSTPEELEARRSVLKARVTEAGERAARATKVAELGDYGVAGAAPPTRGWRNAK